MQIPMPTSDFKFSYPGMTVADLKNEAGYIAPPAELELPHYKNDPDGLAFSALENWFVAQGIDFYDGPVIYLAERHGIDLKAAELLRDEYVGNQPLKTN